MGLLHDLFVCIAVQRPSQQGLGHVDTEPLIPGY